MPTTPCYLLAHSIHKHHNQRAQCQKNGQNQTRNSIRSTCDGTNVLPVFKFISHKFYSRFRYFVFFRSQHLTDVDLCVPILNGSACNLYASSARSAMFCVHLKNDRYWHIPIRNGDEAVPNKNVPKNKRKKSQRKMREREQKNNKIIRRNTSSTLYYVEFVNLFYFTKRNSNAYMEIKGDAIYAPHEWRPWGCSAMRIKL